MSDRVVPGPVQENASVREAVCIHTGKIFDSCRDKDCVEDLRFYPTMGSQSAVDRAISIKAGKAELISANVDVEPVEFHRGFYTVDVRYFYRVTADAFVGAARPVPIHGLAVFDKRVILFGSEGGAKVFSSGEDRELGQKGRTLPTAIVEAVDPILLGVKLVEVCDCRSCDCDLREVPEGVCSCFGEDLCYSGEGKRVYITLGQFSIIRLERDTQLLIPVYDYCMPEKECTCGSGEEDPCEIFRQVKFPVDKFFPPNATGNTEGCGDFDGCCGC